VCVCRCIRVCLSVCVSSKRKYFDWYLHAAYFRAPSLEGVHKKQSAKAENM